MRATDRCCRRAGRAIAISAAAAAATVLPGRSAFAGDGDPLVGPPPADESAIVRTSASVRAAAGLGGGVPGVGPVGIAARLSLAAEGWFDNHIGIGGFAGTSGQTSIIYSAEMAFAGVDLALRTSGREGYVLFTVGIARGWGRSSKWALVDPPPAVDHGGAVLSSTVGWVARNATGFEPALFLAVEYATWGAATVTLNAALGFGAGGR